MNSFGKQLAGAGILLLGLLAFIGCPTGSNVPSAQYWTVTFNTDGGNPSTIAQIQVEKGKTMGTQYPSDPTKGSWKFAGWYLASDTEFKGKKYDAAAPITGNTALKAKWTAVDTNSITININITGNETGDSVTASPASGKAGDVITINYNLANTKTNNRLAFSGITPAINAVTAVGTGTRTYTIVEADSAEGVININAAFTHTDLQLDTIAFADTGNVEKVYGDASFTRAITNNGAGTGAITYTSGDQTVATVTGAGAVTILKTGTTTITASKAADANYEQATATYTLTVTPLQLTIENPTVTTTKPYDGAASAVVTAGALANKVGSDAVTVTAVANYNSANVAEANQITVVYAISGANAENYIKPVDYLTSGSITKAAGGAVNTNPTAASITANSITITVVTVTSPNTGSQTAEYAISAAASPVPTSGWQTGLTFSGLTPDTNYYIFARSKENENYNAGAAKASAAIKTQAAGESQQPAVITKIDFEADAIGKTYESTKAGSAPTVKVAADPINSGQKSLQITSTTYNQAAIVPVNLPYELQNYKSFSFRFNLLSSANLTNQSIMVYLAKNSTTFAQYGFGNPADSSYAQFAANLLGSTAAETIGDNHRNKWTAYTLTISNPGAAIKDLKGDLYIAIGINCQNGADYMFDDLIFTPKDDYTPPPIIVLPTPQPPTAGAVLSGNYRNMFIEWGKTDAEVTAKVNTAFNKLFVNGTTDEKIFVEDGNDMAYIYTADTDDVRSEGMSYGMMMCVQMNDQARFDKLWKWARTYMYNTVNNGSNNRGYFSWQLSTNGNKKDQGPAPDGEEYFITALLFAHARWGSSASGINNYAKEARQIIYDLTRRKPGNGDPYGEPSMFNTDNYMVRFATLGNSATFTDPSYHLPAFYEVWALELENDWNNNNLYGIWSSKADLKTDVDFYKQAANVSRDFFQKTTNATTGLGPDYAEFSGTPTGGNHADFRFDAWRIAMNIGMDYAWWAADAWQKTFANRIQAFFVSKGVTSYGNEWTLSGTQLGADHSPGLVGCNAVASLAATHENAWKFIDDFWNISMTTGKYRYYDGCLYMMCMLHLSGNFKAYLSSNTTPTPSSSISPTTASFDKKTSQQADISVTMTLNGNTLSNIKNGSTTLTSGSSGNYTVSGNTVTIKKEYLAAQADGTTTLVFTFSAGAAQNLVITIADTSNSSISPTSAAFDKRSDLQADITVTMTLNGNTLTSISNNGTNLTNGTNYTQSGSTVTIKKEYLAAQAVGTTTLVFTFNAGATSSLVITVKESPAGGGTGTSYNFANDTFLAGYPKYSASGITAAITGGVLRIEKTTSSSTVSFVLSFNIGAGGNISNYSSIKVNIRGVSGDYTYKDFRAWAGTTTSTQLGTVASALTTSFKDITMPLSGSLAANNDGVIELGFGFPNANSYVYEIKSIELIPK